MQTAGRAAVFCRWLHSNPAFGLCHVLMVSIAFLVALGCAYAVDRQCVYICSILKAKANTPSLCFSARCMNDVQCDNLPGLYTPLRNPYCSIQVAGTAAVNTLLEQLVSAGRKKVTTHAAQQLEIDVALLANEVRIAHVHGAINALLSFCPSDVS